MGEFLSKPVTAKVSNDYDSPNLRCGVSSMQGWRTYQEDAHTSIMEYDKDASLFAVYDGHGGPEVADYCSRNFPDFLKETKQYKEGNFEEALKEAFLEFDMSLKAADVQAELKDIYERKREENKKSNESFNCSPINTQRLDTRNFNGRGMDAMNQGFNTRPLNMQRLDPHNFSGRGTDALNQAFSNFGEMGFMRPGGIGRVTVGVMRRGEDGETPFVDHSNNIREEPRLASRESYMDGKGDAITETETNEVDGSFVKGDPFGTGSPFQNNVLEPEQDTDYSLKSGSTNLVAESSKREDEEAEEDANDSAGGTSWFNTFQPGYSSGCTAVVALLVGSDLFVANAGDSRCVVCRDGQAVEMSKDHKPEDKLERDRIEGAGGTVTSDGRINGNLNLSRAFGNHVYKNLQNVPASEQMITALPDVQRLTIDPAKDEFMVLACDGIWNSMSSQGVVDFVRDRLNKTMDKPSQICEQLFDYCLAPDMKSEMGLDNMTCIIVHFKALAAVSNTQSAERAGA